MTLAIPTTAELRDNIVAGIESTIGQTVPFLPQSFIRVLASVLAGVLITLYRFGGFTFNQMFVQTATFDTTTINGNQVQPLVFLGRLVGVGDPSPGVQAELSITLTVNTDGTLPAGTQFQHLPSGVVYVTVSSNPINGPTTDVTVRAASDQSGGSGIGVIGNRLDGDVLSSVNPVAAIGTDAPVTSTVLTGVDAETESAYRQRVLDRWQFRPQGGAYADYREWAVGVDGIINAYPYTSTQPGEINVYVESGTETDGIPTVDQINAVRAAIELDDAGLATRRPAGALVQVESIIRTSFDVTVVGMAVEDSAQVTTDLTTALTEYFLDREPFIIGVTLPPRKDQITQTGVAGVVEDVITAAGGTFDGVTVSPSLGGGDITNYSLSEGEKTKLLTLTT